MNILLCRIPKKGMIFSDDLARTKKTFHNRLLCPSCLAFPCLFFKCIGLGLRIPHDGDHLFIDDFIRQTEAVHGTTEPLYVLLEALFNHRTHLLRLGRRINLLIRLHRKIRQRARFREKAKGFIRAISKDTEKQIADYQKRQARIQEKAIAQATAKKLESEKKKEESGSN